jgi:hypothetical protein
MALQASGAISISELATEFGDTIPNSLSEFYNGGSLVPSVAYDTVTASSLTGSNSPNYRYPAIGGYDPQINTQGRLYTQALWGDNGSTITMDRSFNVNKTGSYSYYVGYYIQGSGTANVTLYVAGSQVVSHSLPVGYNTTTSATGTLSVSANQTIRMVGSGPSSGWAVIYVYIGGSSYNNNTIQIANNSSVPTSGALSLSNFYGASS